MSPYPIPQSAIKLLHAAKAIGDLAVCVCATFLKPTIIAVRGGSIAKYLAAWEAMTIFISNICTKNVANCPFAYTCCLLLPHALSTSTIKQKVNSSSINFFFTKKLHIVVSTQRTYNLSCGDAGIP